MISAEGHLGVGLVAENRLAHQQLVEIGVDQRADDRVDLPVVIVDAGGDVDHGGLLGGIGASACCKPIVRAGRWQGSGRMRALVCRGFGARRKPVAGGTAAARARAGRGAGAGAGLRRQCLRLGVRHRPAGLCADRRGGSARATCSAPTSSAWSTRSDRAAPGSGPGQRVLADTFGSSAALPTTRVAKETLWVPVPRRGERRACRRPAAVGHHRAHGDAGPGAPRHDGCW